VQGWLTAQLREAALRAGRDDIISLWAGQGAQRLKFRRAAELFDSLQAG
jgi:nitronate monooxygenase